MEALHIVKEKISICNINMLLIIRHFIKKLDVVIIMYAEVKNLVFTSIIILLLGLVTEGIFRKVGVTSVTPSGFPYVDQVTPTVTIAVFGNGCSSSMAEEIGRIAAVLSLSGSWDSEIPRALFEMVLKEKSG